MQTEKACGDTDQPKEEPTEMSSFTEEEMVQDAPSSPSSSTTKTKQKQRQKQKRRVAAPASVGKQYEQGSTTSNGVTRIACRYKKNSNPRKQDKQDDKGNDKVGKSQRRGSISLEKISLSTMPSGGLSASFGDIKFNHAENMEDEQPDPLTPRKAAAVRKAGNWLSKSSRKLSRALTNTGTSKDTTTPASPHANKAAKTQALTECLTPSKKVQIAAAAAAAAFPSTTPTTPDRRPRIQQLNRGGVFKSPHQPKLQQPKTPTSSAKPSYGPAGLSLDSFEDEYQSILCEFDDSTRALGVKSKDPASSPIVVASTLSLSLSSPLGENHDQDTKDDDLDLLLTGPPLVQKEQPDQRRMSIGGNGSWHQSLSEGLLNAYDDIIADYGDDDDDDNMAALDAPPPPSNPPSPPSPSQQQRSTSPPSTVHMLVPPIEV